MWVVPHSARKAGNEPPGCTTECPLAASVSQADNSAPQPRHNRSAAIRPKNGVEGSAALRIPRQAFCPSRVGPSMSIDTGVAPDVFSAREIAAAVGVSAREVRRLMDAGMVRTLDGRFASARDAVAAVRRFRGAATLETERTLFAPGVAAERSPGRAFAASGALHAAMVAVIVLATSLGVSQKTSERPPEMSPVRLVFLATPGPGGGGGGGGLRQPAPPPKAEMKGKSALKSPVPPP